MGAFYDTGLRLIIVEEEKKQKKIDPVVLRSKCKCADCIDQNTGESKLVVKDIDP